MTFQALKLSQLLLHWFSKATETELTAHRQLISRKVAFKGWYGILLHGGAPLTVKLLHQASGNANSLVLLWYQFLLTTSTLPRWTTLCRGESDPGGRVWSEAPPPGVASRSPCLNSNAPRAAAWPLSLDNTWMTCCSQHALLMALKAGGRNTKTLSTKLIIWTIVQCIILVSTRALSGLHLRGKWGS